MERQVRVSRYSETGRNLVKPGETERNWPPLVIINL